MLEWGRNGIKSYDFLVLSFEFIKVRFFATSTQRNTEGKNWEADSRQYIVNRLPKMSQQITREQAEKVAHLARLDLTTAELDLFSGQLSAIVEYIQKLDELDTKNVEPLAHCLPVHNVFRDDVVRPSLDVEKALENAPYRVDDYFKVPQILDAESNA